MRRAKIDANHGEIVETFRACGCLVQSLARMGALVPSHAGACFGQPDACEGVDE